MGLKIYSVTLEESEIKKMKERISSTGGKVSPIINRLIKEWNLKREEESGTTC